MKKLFLAFLPMLVVGLMIFLVERPGFTQSNITQPFADATHNGILRATDWVLFHGGATGGTVTNVATGCALTGGPITTTGTIAGSEGIDVQSVTSYAVPSSDCGKILYLSNIADVALTIAQAGTGGFVAGWYVDISDQSGAFTLTPTTSLVNGGSSYPRVFGGYRLVSNGTNYFIIPGINPGVTSPLGGGGTSPITCSTCVTTPQVHSITFAINGASGGAITSGAIGVFPPIVYACTINEVDVTGAPSGSISVDIWKANAAIPTSGNKISASDPATLSSAQRSVDTMLTGWSKSVVPGDVFGGTIVSATSVTAVTLTIWCQ